MDHAMQQIDAKGVMIGMSRQWYEEAKAKLAAYEEAEAALEAQKGGETK